MSVFDPPSFRSMAPAEHHNPWKVWLGLYLWAAGVLVPLAPSIVYASVISQLFLSAGALFLGVGVVHAMARLQLVAMRSAILASGRRLSPLPPAMIVAAALYYAVSVWFPQPTPLATIFGAVAVILGLGGWRWWMAEIVAAVSS